MKKLSVSYLILFFCLTITHGRKHTIFWDENMEPRLKEGLKMDVQVNDWMDILCPQPVKTSENLSNPVQADYYLELFNVTAEHYKHCATTGQRRLLHCKDPRKETKLTTKFQTRSPSPIGFVFRPGETYYYLSKPLHKSNRGCNGDTLRMEITVKEKIDFDRKIFHQSAKSQDGSHFHYHHHQQQKALKSKPSLSKAQTLDRVAPSNEKKNPENAGISTLSCRNSSLFIVFVNVLFSFVVSNSYIL